MVFSDEKKKKIVETIFKKNISFVRARERIKASEKGRNGAQYFSRADKPTI